MNCLFCKIISGDIPSMKIYEDEKFYAFLDITPLREGHTLLVPKKCIKDLLSATELEIEGHLKVIKYIESLLSGKLNSKGMSIMTNNKLGQEVQHLHWHLVPTYEGQKITIKRIGPEDLELVFKKIES